MFALNYLLLLVSAWLYMPSMVQQADEAVDIPWFSKSNMYDVWQKIKERDYRT